MSAYLYIPISAHIDKYQSVPGEVCTVATAKRAIGQGVVR